MDDKRYESWMLCLERRVGLIERNEILIVILK